MSKLNNIFIVKSPLQIINSIEMILSFKLEKNILLVIYNDTDNTNIQMNKLINYYKWQKIIYVNKSKLKSKYFEYIKLVRELKKYNYEHLVFSNFGSIHKLIIANIKAKSIYYIDDGLETVNNYTKILLPNKINKFNLRQARFWLFGLKTKIIGSIHLFTYFDLKPFRNSNIIKNNLINFQNKYLSTNKLDSNCYLLGQPLVTTNLIKTEDYFDYIDLIIKKTKINIIYIPHRTEIISNKLKSFISNKFQIKNINMPIELYFLEKNIYPNSIVSFMTTAFFTLKKLYSKTNYRYIYIPSNKILERHLDVSGAYKFIEKLNITKIEP